MATKKIIIDCDPGVDDAIAIMLALSASEELELLGITTVAGNVALDHTTRNALGICNLLGRSDVGVYAGCSRPLMRTTGHRSIMHGAEGLGGVVLDTSGTPRDAHAIDFIIDTVMANPGQVTLCPIGPLTNVAMAIVKEPRLAANIDQIVFMGGAAFRPGNTTPAAEFNIYVDPHSAHIVATAGAPLVMFGLDVTNTVVATPGRLKTLQQLDNDAGRQAVAMISAYAKGDPCLHDPCVIAWLLRPELFTGIEAFLEIDSSPGINQGRTVACVGERHLAGTEPNCWIITGADCDGIFALLSDKFNKLT
ncbi:nucleoside hydrolase [Rhizobium calliandrae]|uniref:Nucleoside hydrolase n=1 Tax=Rhizobium calliandrae TaxID=1312182 RepID=A0ABT7KLS0_9HYPH|nr:nucleoside hydrolase [Rhizobium calliandrae]MDL2409591.1 nucleoside hydrolase [Rhizobium calliandrae]